MQSSDSIENNTQEQNIDKTNPEGGVTEVVKLEETVQESIQPENIKTVNIIIVDFTAFNVRGEKVFFDKRIDEVKFELMDACKTTVIHKIKEYQTQLISENETIVEKPIKVFGSVEENTMTLLQVRRDLLRLAKIVNSKKTRDKLIKKYKDLDTLIMKEKLD